MWQGQIQIRSERKSSRFQTEEFEVNNQPTHALVAYLASQQGDKGTLGKKAVQKYIHILSSLSGLDVGYEFSFYTYGPFSRELASDLDILDGAKAISVRYNSTDNAYSITATPTTHTIAQALPAALAAEANRIWAIFSGRTAKELELISTALFVSDEEGLPMASTDMTSRIQALKPKYSTAEIRAAQTELAALI
jgi:uncharacterized protein